MSQKRDSPFLKVGVVEETKTGKMMRLRIYRNPQRVFEAKYYVYTLDVKAFLEGRRKNISIYMIVS